MKINEIPSKIIIFLKEVKLEMKKVNWPAREQTIRYTLIVVGICVVVALFLGTFDFLFTTMIDKFILSRI